jgi:hypothetical protein
MRVSPTDFAGKMGDLFLATRWLSNLTGMCESCVCPLGSPESAASSHS